MTTKFISIFYKANVQKEKAMSPSEGRRCTKKQEHGQDAKYGGFVQPRKKYRCLRQNLGFENDLDTFNSDKSQASVFLG